MSRRGIIVVIVWCLIWTLAVVLSAQREEFVSSYQIQVMNTL